MDFTAQDFEPSSLPASYLVITDSLFLRTSHSPAFNWISFVTFCVCKYLHLGGKRIEIQGFDNLLCRFRPPTNTTFLKILNKFKVTCICPGGRIFWKVHTPEGAQTINWLLEAYIHGILYKSLLRWIVRGVSQYRCLNNSVQNYTTSTPNQPPAWDPQEKSIIWFYNTCHHSFYVHSGGDLLSEKIDRPALQNKVVQFLCQKSTLPTLWVFSPPLWPPVDQNIIYLIFNNVKCDKRT